MKQNAPGTCIELKPRKRYLNLAMSVTEASQLHGVVTTLGERTPSRRRQFVNTSCLSVVNLQSWRELGKMKAFVLEGDLKGIPQPLTHCISISKQLNEDGKNQPHVIKGRPQTCRRSWHEVIIPGWATQWCKTCEGLEFRF